MAFRISLLLLLLATPPAQPPTSIAGRIIDLDGGGPLANVRVSLCDPASSSHDVHLPTWTDAQGRYVLPDVPPGSWCVRAVYTVEDVSYRLTTPVLSIGERPFVLHFDMPTLLHDRVRHRMDPQDVSPKSVSTITGLLQDGIVRDAEGLFLPGSKGRLHVLQTGLLHGSITQDTRSVAGALVFLPDTNHRTHTNAQGRFALTDIEPGHYALHIVHRLDTLTVPPFEIRTGLNPINFSFRR